MKFSFFTFICFSLIFKTFANEKIIKVKSSIHKVVAFLDGAEIIRSSEFQLSAGRSDLYISNLSTQIHPKSIQASISGNARILAITTEKNYLNPHQNIEKAKTLNDSLILLTDQIQQLNTEVIDIDEERSMILANKNRLGEKGGVTVTELQSASLFFKTRLKEISKEKFSIKVQLRKLTKTHQQIKKQLTTDNTLKEQPSNIVIIKVDNPTNQKAVLNFSYVVSEAGWTPKYNVRAEGIDQPIQFEYMAKVFNNTAIDWKNVNLILSTGNPFKSLTVPTLETWSLNYGYRSKYHEGYLQKKGSLKNTSSQNTQQQNFKNNENVNVEVSELTVDFVIKEKYSIPADNKPYLVDVNNYELPTTYKYYTIPKLECEAFLMANVVNWENVNIIDSYANIYYKGKYVGESFISTSDANDTLAFSMGRDAKINVSRVKKEDFNKKKWIGLNRTESFEYEIAVRNTYNTPIEIEIIDQVPVSQENDIEVELKNISNAELDEQSGRLKWKVKIDPKVTKRFETSFSVKYPRNKRVNIRKTRMLRTPKYRHEN